MALESSGPVTERHPGKRTFALLIDDAPTTGATKSFCMVGLPVRAETTVGDYGVETSDGIRLSLAEAQRLAMMLMEAVGGIDLDALASRAPEL